MRCPLAVWRGSPNENPGGEIAEPYGEVWHVEQGTEVGTIQVFSEPSWQASSHFGIAREGDLAAVLAAIAHLRASGSAADLAPVVGIDGFVDVHDRAWAEGAGNSYWISFEDEGFTGQPLTEFQVQAHVLLTLWLRTDPTGPRFIYPLQLTDDPNGRGIGWHGMGGAAWGGHLQCPGEPIKAQRQTVIDLIQGADHMATSITFVVPGTDGHPYGYHATDPDSLAKAQPSELGGPAAIDLGPWGGTELDWWGAWPAGSSAAEHHISVIRSTGGKLWFSVDLTGWVEIQAGVVG